MDVNPVRVLCVENRADYMAMLKHDLERSGCEVLTADTAKEALGLLVTELIEGVLLEYDLPGATGAAVRADMKLLRPEVPILLFNGISSQTPFLLRFFTSYLQDPRPEDGNG
jgi:response regulator RpfG family c-di-GMP phosphodiesterase